MKETDRSRRKVRKGTRSCWECRRRKIGCRFDRDADEVCVACRAAQRPCLSQEFTPESVPPPSDRGLARRMSRLEEMVGSLLGDGSAAVDSLDETTPKLALPTPSESTATSNDSPIAMLTKCMHEQSVDLLDSSAAGHARSIADLIAGHVPSPPPRPRRRIQEPSHTQYTPLSHTIHGLFPSPLILQTLASQKTIAADVLGLFYTRKDCAEGKSPPPSCLTTAPDPEKTHPTVMARRLTQLALCLQDHEGFDAAAKGVLTRENLQGRTVTETVHLWASSVGALIANHDNLIASQEGLECLTLLSYVLSEAGHMRRSWMAARRAMSIAQLMGVDRIRPWQTPVNAALAIHSVDPDASPSRRPSAITLWYLINMIDRSLSLPLGLPIGSHDDSFADPAVMEDDSPEVRLNKTYIVIARRIADRNDMAHAASSGSGCQKYHQEQMQRQNLPNGSMTTTTRPTCTEAFAATQVLDLELERAAQMMNDLWWQIPDLTYPRPTPGFTTPGSSGISLPIYPQSCALKLQMRHYGLLVLVHLPYMLYTDKTGNSQRYEYSRTTCLSASRAVLERFLSMRRVFTSPVSARLYDYTALVAGMTLLLGYRHVARDSMGKDGELVEAVVAVMHDMGVKHGDKLSQESAETLREMMPAATGEETVDLEQPVSFPSESPTFLGTSFPHDVPMDDYWGDMEVGSMDEWALQGVEATYWSMLNVGKDGC